MIGYLTIILTFLEMKCFASAKNSEKTQHCLYIYDNSFHHCSQLSQSTNDLPNRIYNATTSYQPLSKLQGCPEEHVCGKIFKISRVHGQLFANRSLAKISDMLAHCCSNCGKFVLDDMTMELPHMTRREMESSDIIFPVLGRASLTELYGYNYIPLFELPGAYYFTLEITEEEIAHTIIEGCLSMWPLLLVCVLWAFVSGFFMWLFETWWNTDQFPRSFIPGLFEGFWWSFISMTTVGYGDRIPKRYLGRIFAIFWILIGVTITSMYIGAMAGTIYSLKAPPKKASLNGRIVGGLKHQLQDATIVAQHGGILLDIDVEDELIGVVELIKMLRGGKIEGFVINKVTYQNYHQASKKSSAYKELLESVKDIHLARTELDYKSEKVVTGMLVKDEDDFNFFRRYFSNNWLQLQACNSFELNSRDEALRYNEASHFEGLFYPYFYGTLFMIAAILCFGILYEIVRRKYTCLLTPEQAKLCDSCIGDKEMD